MRSVLPAFGRRPGRIRACVRLYGQRTGWFGDGMVSATVFFSGGAHADSAPAPDGTRPARTADVMNERRLTRLVRQALEMCTSVSLGRAHRGAVAAGRSAADPLSQGHTVA